MSAATKPVRLQFNQMGAWRNAIDFDAADPNAAGEVMFYGAMLAECTKATARVITTDGMQSALAIWSSDKGWRDAKTGKPVAQAKPGKRSTT
jgi:hypothetical protein